MSCCNCTHVLKEHCGTVTSYLKACQWDQCQEGLLVQIYSLLNVGWL